MRLPFPERIPLRYAIGFAASLCAVQLFQGTPTTISLCCFLFIIIATFTFNVAGGFSRTSGGYVFFYAVLAVIVGIFWKAFIGEPADSNLKQPLLTFEIYVGGISAMLASVYLSRRLTIKRAILGDMLSDANMMNASIGCMLIGISLTVLLDFTLHQSGSILSALSQVNFFPPLAIILGTVAQIRKSKGRSSINLVVLLAAATIFAQGLVSFSKQGIFTPLLSWLIASASQRYRVTLYQVVGVILMAAFMVYYLVPFSQYGREYRTESATENIRAAISLLSHPNYVREQYELTVASSPDRRVVDYFDESQGFFDRLQMIAPDDGLNNATEENGPIGLTPILFGFENVIPHFLWKGKPTFTMGNIYAREIGMIGDEDTTTGVSFSPTGEAYHLAGWVGIFVVAPLLWIPLFALFDSLCGDVRRYPWGLLTIVIFGHIAPEGMLQSVIYSLWYVSFGIVFVAVVSSYLTPIIGSIFTLSNRTGLRRTVTVRSIPRRLPDVRPSQNFIQ